MSRSVRAVIEGLTRIHHESNTPEVDFGLNAATVFNGMMSVIKANLVPILTLMGLAIGAAWVVKYFNHAKNGRM